MVYTNSIEILSIHLEVDGFSFYFIEGETTATSKKHYLVNENTPEKYTERLGKELKNLSTHDFSTFRLVFSNALFTLIPNALYDENRISDYIEFSNFLLPNDPIEAKLIPSLDIQFLYSYTEEIELSIKKLFPEKTIDIQHNGCALIEKLIPYSSDKNYFIWLNFSSIELFYFQNGQLVFYNFFETQTKEDILYYTLFVAQQLNIDVNKDPLYVIGNLEAKNEALIMMKKYIRYVETTLSETITP